MLELEVVLDFACCTCGHDMGVTLKCEGKGLVTCLHSPQFIKIACPTCGDHNQICFTPAGNLCDVASGRKNRIPVPSRN